MSRLLSNKKGIDMLMMTFGLVMIALIVFLLFTTIANRQGKNKDFLLSYHAEDLQLLFENLQAVPGDVVVPYELTQDITLDLAQDRFTLIDEETQTEKRYWLHLTTDMRVREGTATGSFTIIKEENTIRLGTGSLFITTEKCTTPRQQKQFSIITLTGSTSKNNTNKEYAKTIKESIDYQLQQNGMPTQTSTNKLTLTISVADDTRPTLTLIRPRADLIENQDYEYIYCMLQQTYNEQFELQEAETHQTANFQVEIIIGLPPKEQKQFFDERTDFANKLALILANFKE